MIENSLSNTANLAQIQAPLCDPRSTLMLSSSNKRQVRQRGRYEVERTREWREVDTSESAPTANIADVDEPVIAININQQYPTVQSAEDLYNCTRGIWRVNKEHASKAKYAFAVYKGVIKEVYTIDRWIPASEATLAYWKERELAQGKYFPPEVHAGRSEFVGEVAPEAIRKEYVGKRVPLRPAQSSIRYIDC